MCVIGPISTVFRQVIYLYLFNLYSLCSDLQCWEWKCVTGFFGKGWGDCNNVVLQVIAQKMKIYSYLYVGECPYP